jgi:hypothetical protein
MSLTHIATRLKSATKDWQTFLSERYEGGSRLVSNPNLETKDQYPQVTVNTALKDESFRKHVEKEFDQWKNTQKPVKKSFQQRLLDSTELDKVIEKYRNGIDEIDSSVNGENNIFDYYLDMAKRHLKSVESRPENDSVRILQNDLLKEFDNMSDMDKKLISQSFKFGNLYKHKWPNIADTSFRELASNWIDSSIGGSSKSLHNYLSEIGVKGTTYGREDIQSIPSDSTIKQLKEAYTYQQAIFKHLGVTHVTLYRGVRDDQLKTDPPSHGDKVQIKTREASSWTLNPYISKNFGTRMIKCKVPVEHILMSPINVREMGNDVSSEFECVVMGAEDLDCTVFSIYRR